MNSNTGDFSEIRRIALRNELHMRSTQSSVKRLPYIPRKLTIRPLNLNGIKKELEESFEEKQEVPPNVISSRCEVIVKVQPNAHTSDFPNKLEKICEENPIEEMFSIDSIDNDNLKEITLKKEKENIYGHKNDSFDLDFSTLTTPNNKKIVNYKNVSNEVEKFIASEHNLLCNRTNFHNSSQKMILETPIANDSNNMYEKTFQKDSEHAEVDASLSELLHLELRENDHFVKEEISPTHSPMNIPQCDIFERITVNNVEYVKLNMLGRGGSSEVFHCYNIKSKLHVAIKFISLQNSNSASGYINEVKLLQQLQKCNKIIKLYNYEIFDDGKKLLVVLEKGGEDLSVILKQLAVQKSHIPMYMLLFYWLEMLHAVKQIHSHGIIHSDLKPANFIKADGGLKLIDFGIASSVQTDMTSVIKPNQEGSCNYISPEALNNESGGNNENQNYDCGKYKLHFKSDVWSLGCILYQLVYRQTPFQHISKLWPKLATIMDPKHDIHYPAANWVSPKIINTIKKCLQYNVKSRPSVDELIKEYETILHNI